MPMGLDALEKHKLLPRWNNRKKLNEKASLYEGHGFSRAINSPSLTASAAEVRFSQATGRSHLFPARSSPQTMEKDVPQAHIFSAKCPVRSETGHKPSPYPPTQANFRRKTRAPNVTCNVWGVGLASKVCHFKKILQFSINRAAQPMKTSKTHLEPRSWVVYGLSTTCWGRHVASGERDR
jgi:hypothetical protein